MADRRTSLERHYFLGDHVPSQQRALLDKQETLRLAGELGIPTIRELWRADFEEREYPQGVPPVAGVFGDASGRVWIGLTEPPPEHLPSGELLAIRRWVAFEEEEAAHDGDLTTLRALGILALPPRSHPLWADTDGVLLVRNDAQLDVAYVEWYPWVDG